MVNSLLRSIQKISQKNDLIKDILYLGSSRYFSLALGVLRGFFLPKLLGPMDYGLWKGLSIITDFSRITQLGTTSALFRQIPILKSKKKTLELSQTVQTAWAINLLNALILSSILIGYSFFQEEVTSRIATRLFAPFLVASEIFMFMKIYFSASKEFTYLAKINFFHALLSISGVIYFTFLWDLYGLILSSFVLLLAIDILFYIRMKRYPVWKYIDEEESHTAKTFRHGLLWKNQRISFFKISASMWGKLIQIGFPIMVSGILLQLVTSIDKIIALSYLGKEALGYYSLGLTLLNMVYQGFFTLNTVLSPRLMENYGKNSDIHMIKSYVFRPMIISSYLAPPILTSLYFLSDFIYLFFLPNYLPGRSSFHFLLLSGFFLLTTNSLMSFFIALKKQKRIIIIQVISLLLAVLLDIVAVKIFKSIDAIALATVVVMFFYSVMIIIHVLWHYYHLNFSLYLNWFGKLYFPLVFSLFIIYFLEQFKGRFPDTTGYIKDITSLIIFMILYIPLFYLGYRIIRNTSTGKKHASTKG